MNPLDRGLLFLTALLAAYQLVVGIDHFTLISIAAFTIAFGALLIAALLMIILGYEVLDSAIIVVFSTIIPLSLALGLVWQHLPAYQNIYLVFSCVGIIAIIGTRFLPAANPLSTLVVSLVHGIAGITIFLLPILLAAHRLARAEYALVGVGGVLIGIGGMLLSFERLGIPILSRQRILRILPGLLLITTLFFVAGFRLG